MNGISRGSALSPGLDDVFCARAPLLSVIHLGNKILSSGAEHLRGRNNEGMQESHPGGEVWSHSSIPPCLGGILPPALGRLVRRMC